MNTTASELPFKVYVNGALNVGVDREEIVEAIMHMIPYVGFVKVQQAMVLAEAVCQERNV